MIRPTARPRVIAAFAAVLLMAACAGPQVDARPQDGERTYSTSDAERTYSSSDVLAPMSISDIVLQLESGRPEDAIVAELFDRGLAAPATPGDLTLLRRAGASPELLQAIYDAPVARRDDAGNVVIIREPAFVPYVIDPWPHYYPGYRHWPPPRHLHRPHRPPPHRLHPHPGRPGPRVIDRPQRPPTVRPDPPRPPTPNRYQPRPQPTPGMRPPMNAPVTKPGIRPSPAARPGHVAPGRPTR